MPEIDKDERLVQFFYTLIRDHIHPGDIENILWDHVEDEPATYCNTYIEGYARNIVDRLTNPDLPLVHWKHMYKHNGIKEIGANVGEAR